MYYALITIPLPAVPYTPEKPMGFLVKSLISCISFSSGPKNMFLGSFEITHRGTQTPATHYQKQIIKLLKTGLL